MAIRRAFFVLTVTAAVLFAGMACADATRQRVLRFFFDGVPEPGAEPPVGYPAPEGADFQEAPAEPGAPRPAARPIFPHAPYRENRCGACHDPQSGSVNRTPQEGLCRGCHPDVPGRARYVHGPVAVGDCLFCHHHHGSPYPGLLLVETNDTCYRCHDRQSTSAALYHAGLESRLCTECHDPHGGEDLFFLKRNEP